MTPRTATSDPTDGRLLRGLRSREMVLEKALQLASVDGLEGLSINRLAGALGTAKSSVHGLFGSKQGLQLAVIEATRKILIDLVMRPSRTAAAGLPRLEALGEAWMAYLDADTFTGGCLLSSASLEMDGRPGPVRDAVAQALQEWLAVLAHNVSAAVGDGDLASDTDPEQLAFELNAIGMSANWHYQLYGNRKAFERGRAGWRHLLIGYQP
ncbi:TetR family transcriptional regulator [Sneathiella marina]|uniref:TetR family transcriptional regulator n=1 Tax=Sneathiella marina TaxID=2950108 RepID=A0ABY4W027_9PROT|nr:TetR family transcriptional regulator [Sneathiella marina]USG60552.1 TetR family transcriptional regulator [Sneathiella marina]